jgi:phosphoribosylformylglycinamidine synthase subunit PurQ / glutaminase
MPRPPAVHAVIPTGFGINCEVETAHALRLAGAEVDLVHLNDLAAHLQLLARARILVLAGGFSFGDHLGSGKVLANRIARRIGPELQRFIADGGLVLGVCNGFQTLARLGIVPSGQIGDPSVALAANQRGTFHDGWVTVRVDPESPCRFTRGIDRLDLPVRHGEGRVTCEPAVLATIRQQHLAPMRYVDPETGQPAESFPKNPNGSIDAIAGICDPSGRIFGLMPHPEAFLYRENHPSWRRRQGSTDEGDGLQIFRNAVAAAVSG